MTQFRHMVAMTSSYVIGPYLNNVLQTNEIPAQQILNFVSPNNALAFFKTLGDILSKNEPLQNKNIQILLNTFQTIVTKLGQTEALRKHGFFISSMNGLRFIELNSVFQPEKWSHVFFSGVIQSAQKQDLQGKTTAEIGCGNGNVTLRLATQLAEQNNLPQKMIASDIVPDAVDIAKVNAFLNSFDINGNPIYLGQTQQRLCDLVEFRCGSGTEPLPTELSFVYGCIPQVLNTHKRFSNGDVCPDNSTAEERFDFSNYSGAFDDHIYGPYNLYGLGLMALILDTIHEHLTPDHTLVFNMGGRLPESVIQTLFTDKGFNLPTELYTERIQQTDDTDIGPLILAEMLSGKPARFYASATGTTVLSAQDATARQKQQLPVYHTVTAYETRCERPSLAKLSEALRRLDMPVRLPRALSVSEHKTLAHLSAREHTYPYGDTPGNQKTREITAHHLFKARQIPTANPDHILLTPTAELAIQNIERLFDAEGMSHTTTAAETEKALSDTQHQVIIYHPETTLQETTLNTLLSTAKEQGKLLVLVGVTEFPIESAFNCANIMLVHRLKSDFNTEVGVVYTPSTRYREALLHRSELTFSRVPHLTQEIIQAQDITPTTPDHTSTPPLHTQTTAYPAPKSLRNAAVLESTRELPTTPNTPFIELDYGENELQAPPAIKAAILYALLNPLSSESAKKTTQKTLQTYLQHAFHFSAVHTHPTYGAAHAFDITAQYLKTQGGPVVFTTGAYGEFLATCEINSVETHTISTQESDHFLLTPDALRMYLSEHPNTSAVYLNVPFVNPTGGHYDAEKLKALLEVIQKHNETHDTPVMVILDTVFEGTDFKQTLKTDLSEFHAIPSTVLFSLSKQCAGGGIRSGGLGTNCDTFARFLESAPLPTMADLSVINTTYEILTATYVSPHELGEALHRQRQDLLMLTQTIFQTTASHQTEKILDAISIQLALLQEMILHTEFVIHQAEKLKTHFNTQAAHLRENFEYAQKKLTPLGWHFTETVGGLFCAIQPPKAFFTQGLTNDSVVKTILDDCQVRINSAEWANLYGEDGLGWNRIVLSLPQATFQAAIDQISKFTMTKKHD